jgi:hypothetical protein
MPLVGGNIRMNGDMMRVAMSIEVSWGISPFAKSLALNFLEIKNAMMPMINKDKYALCENPKNGRLNTLKPMLKTKK